MRYVSTHNCDSFKENQYFFHDWFENCTEWKKKSFRAFDDSVTDFIAIDVAVNTYHIHISSVNSQSLLRIQYSNTFQNGTKMEWKLVHNEYG